MLRQDLANEAKAKKTDIDIFGGDDDIFDSVRKTCSDCCVSLRRPDRIRFTQEDHQEGTQWRSTAAPLLMHRPGCEEEGGGARRTSCGRRQQGRAYVPRSLTACTQPLQPPLKRPQPSRSRRRRSSSPRLRRPVARSPASTRTTFSAEQPLVALFEINTSARLEAHNGQANHCHSARNRLMNPLVREPPLQLDELVRVHDGRRDGRPTDHQVVQVVFTELHNGRVRLPQPFQLCIA